MIIKIIKSLLFTNTKLFHSTKGEGGMNSNLLKILLLVIGILIMVALSIFFFKSAGNGVSELFGSGVLGGGKLAS